MAAPASQKIGTKYGVPGKMWAAGHHTGIDILAPTGTTLKAPYPSKIIHAGTGGWGKAYGIHVIGECTYGGKTVRWMTAHMSSVSVKAGQMVKLGQSLGKSGATGNVTGPHCHFEVRVMPYTYGKDIDPAGLMAATEPKPAVAKWSDPASFKIGATGPDVTRLGQRLVIWAKHLGLPAPYKSGPGSPFTETDRKAVAAFQRAQGWISKDADGFPGKQSLAILASDPKPAPKPQPKPDPKPAMLDTSIFLQNCASLHLGWTKRAKTLADLILASDASIIMCQELYAARRGSLEKHIKHRYERVAVNGGRVTYVRIGRWKGVPGTTKTAKVGRAKKRIVGTKVQHLASGKYLNPVNVHLTWQHNRGTYRREEATQTVAWAKREFPRNRIIFGGDWNAPHGARGRADEVGPAMRAGGYRDAGADVNADATYRLDRVFVGASVVVRRIRTYATTGADHRGVLIEFSFPI